MKKNTLPLFSRVILVIAKLLGVLLRTFKVGSGSTWPGEIALRMNNTILKELSAYNVTIMMISGTNGKTTTAKMLENILRRYGYKVKRNPSGANLDNGIVTGFVDDLSWFGILQSDYFIFEVDEATLRYAVSQLDPKFIVLLNLFRDQLDRYGEVDTISDQWMNTLCTLNNRAQIILNGDDPQLAYMGTQITNTVHYFGIESSTYFLPDLQHATDSIYCPQCGNRLTFSGIYFSHLGKWTCDRCGFTHPKIHITSSDYISPVPGVYNIYNSLAAASVANLLGLSKENIQLGLKSFVPAFGRFEEVMYNGKRIIILLSKNPAGFNESLRTVLSSPDKGPILLILNDRIPDGTDVSWIWDVDFEQLVRTNAMVIVSGDRGYDLCLRLKYSSLPFKQFIHDPDLNSAIELGLKNVKNDDILWIMPTYSAMLDVRKIVTGKKIL